MNDENKNSIQLDSNADAENNAPLNLLYEIGRILASLETMNEAAPQILETICRVLRFELGELWCLGKDETTLRLENVWHLPAAPIEKFVADSRRFRFPVNEGLPGKVWAKSAPVWIADLSSEDGMPRRFFIEEKDLRSAFAFPILLGERLLGVFSFFSRQSRKPDEALLQIFAAVGSHIGQFIKREKIESSLRESEDRYRAFITRSTEGIWRFELDEKFPVSLPIDEQVKLAFERGYLAECNDAMARMYGLEKAADLVGSRVADLFGMSDAANVEYLRSFIESDYNLIDAESHEKDADGNDKYFLNSLIGTIEDGNLVRVWGTQRDITEQKRHAQAMRESEESYRIVAETASDAVIKIDEDSRILFVNSAVERIFGYTVEEMLGQSLTMIMPEELRAAHHAGIRRYLKTGERKLSWESLEIPARHAKGHTFALEISFGAYREHDRRFFIGVARDITDRKQAEKRLTLLAEISEMTRVFEDANEFLFAVSKAVGEHLRVRRCLFNEIDLERDLETVHKDYCRGVESVAGAHRISDYSSITSAEMMAGRTVVNRDSKIDSRTAADYAKTYAPNGERAYVAVPMLRKNRWVASLWVSDDEPRDWSGAEINLLETVAERTWTAIEKLRINNALRNSEERLQLAVDISRIATFDIDLTTDEVQTDQTGRAIYGFEPNEPLTFAKVQSHFHPEDRDGVARRVEAAFAPEGSDEFEVEQRIIRTDGEVRWIRVRGRAFFEGEGTEERRAVYCLGTYIDITDSKRGEETLLERERLALLNSDVSRALIKHSSLQDILRACTSAVVKHLDAAFARVWTLNEKENVLELQASSGIYTHLDGEHSRVPVGKFKIGTIAAERQPHLTNSVVGDVRVSDQEWAKQEKMVAFAGYPLLVEDRLVGVVAMFARKPLAEKTVEALAAVSNVIALGIERKQTESERERLLASEQQARQIAEDANHSKDEFIALVSHELRSPLNAMLGWTRILQEQKPDEKTKEYALDVIVRNARSQSRLIEDLLDIARVGKGKLRLELQPTELIPIINAAIEIIKPTAEAGKIKLSQTLDRAANFITGDVDRLRQVIENLLANAVKFTPPGGSVLIALERDERDAKIVVSDTGQGISREFLPQIFERFKQADPSTTRRHGGLGIGLSLAHDLVELHGGAISAESAGEGKGATFTVTLPLRTVAPIKENSDKVEFMDAQGKLSGFWILAVDDEADARELVSFMLQINGAKVTTANSAVEALDILKNTDGRLPDILLSDISMPNESGYALLEKIRALPSEHGGQIPAVALTAFNRPEDREAAFDAGFQKHLGKPVEPDDLISAIIETAGAK
jgi:PAS domain S-box-containing protein